jgi:hypothetical protein
MDAISYDRLGLLCITYHPEAIHDFEHGLIQVEEVEAKAIVCEDVVEDLVVALVVVA